jgi:hypothetical protein
MREYVITPHAKSKMARRGLEEEMIRWVLAAPEQRLEVRPGRIVLQSKVAMGVPARSYLVRVFVDTDRQPPEVVTAYRTSKILKYWEVDA